MELDLECPESNWIFPSWISVGLIYSGLGYMWIWSKKKKMDHWISYMQNPKIHGSPSIKHPVLGIHETRVTPPSVPGHRQSPGRCNGKSAHDGWVAAPTSWGRRRGWLGCWRGWVRCWAGRCCRKVVLVPAHAIPCSAQHGGEVGQCQVHLGLLPSQKWACGQGIIQTMTAWWHKAKWTEVFPSLVSYDPMAAELDDQQVYQRCLRLLQAKAVLDATAMSLSHVLALWIAAISTCGSARPAHSSGNHQEASGSMVNLRVLW